MRGLEDNLIQLKITSKQLVRQSKKCQKEEAIEKAKIKKAIQDGNLEGARIYAANAIRKKNEALNLLRLASRIDGVASRVQTAITTRMVTSSMANVVKGMDKAMGSMNLEKITMVMEKFESQFETLDAQAAHTESVMSGTTSLMSPENEVESMIQQVVDEHGLDIEAELALLEPSTVLDDQTKNLEQTNASLARLRALRE